MTKRRVLRRLRYREEYEHERNYDPCERYEQLHREEYEYERDYDEYLNDFDDDDDEDE
jgi:hypothetical protein